MRMNPLLLQRELGPKQAQQQPANETIESKAPNLFKKILIDSQLELNHLEKGYVPLKMKRSRGRRTSAGMQWQCIVSLTADDHDTTLYLILLRSPL